MRSQGSGFGVQGSIAGAALALLLLALQILMMPHLAQLSARQFLLP